MRIMQVRAAAAALDAALAHGLLAALAEQPASASGVAAARGVDAVACARVLEVLRAHGIVERAGEAYAVPEPVRRELLLPDLGTDDRFRLWSHTAEFLSSGRPLWGVGGSGDRAAAYVESTPYLARLFERPAVALAERLAPAVARRPAVSVLDVGAGSGVWSLALLERLPHARGRAVDLPEVVPRYLERAEELGLSDRVDAVAGDYHLADAGGRHDIVLLANVLHLEPAAGAARLLRHWAAAVAEGGLLVVVDMLAETAAAPEHAAYALHLALRVSGAYPHLEPELRSWLAAAGFGCVERIALEEGAAALGAIAASRSSRHSPPVLPRFA